MTDTVPGASKGLLESLSNFASTLVGILHTRFSLASTELEEYRAHVFALLILALVAVFFIGLGVVLATILLVVAFWDSDRLLVLGLLTGFYLAVGVVAGVRRPASWRAMPDTGRASSENSGRAGGRRRGC